MIGKILRKIARPIRKLTELLQAVFLYYQRYGLRRLTIRALAKVATQSQAPKLRRAYNLVSYGRWIKKNEPTKQELRGQAAQHFALEPRISLLVPCYRTPPAFLKALVESVYAQTYRHWQLCLAVAGQMPSETESYLATLPNDDRVAITRLESNGGITANTAEALKVATGEFIGFIDHDDTLAPFALFEVVSALNQHPESDLLYSDEDKISENGSRRHAPHFKPDWSPDMLRSYNYITHFLVVKRALIEKVGGIGGGFDGCQDYDLTLRASEQARMITHIPKVLYHWRKHHGSTSVNTESKPEAAAVAEKVVAAHLKRIGRIGEVSAGPFFGAVDVRYKLSNSPLVSIIIPNHDHADDLAKCVASITTQTTYPNYEIVVMENHSREEKTQALYKNLSVQGVRVVEWKKPFNYSEINNDGAVAAHGDILLFLNNDMAVITPNWIEEMLMHLQYEEVGAVGAKLYYADGSVQHAGVILGIGGIAGHSHKGSPHDDSGYFGRLKVVQDFSAVTGACLMVKRRVFEAVGGLDVKLPIAFNDIDLCLKVRQKGYLVVWTPRAELYHYESKTRGYEDTYEKQQRFLAEIDYFKRKWSDTLKAGDLYYSPNLTLSAEDFSINA